MFYIDYMVYICQVFHFSKQVLSCLTLKNEEHGVLIAFKIQSTRQSQIIQFVCFFVVREYGGNLDITQSVTKDPPPPMRLNSVNLYCEVNMWGGFSFLFLFFKLNLNFFNKNKLVDELKSEKCCICSTIVQKYVFFPPSSVKVFAVKTSQIRKSLPSFCIAGFVVWR